MFKLQSFFFSFWFTCPKMRDSLTGLKQFLLDISLPPQIKIPSTSLPHSPFFCSIPFSLIPLIDPQRPVKEQTFSLPVTLHHSVQLALYGHANTLSHTDTHTMKMIYIFAYSLDIQMKKIV